MADTVTDQFHRISTDSRRRTIPLVPFMIALVLAGVVVPVLVAPVPLMTDYPNHLARMWLLDGGADMPFLQSVYRAKWDTLTNIGTDLLAVGLMNLFSYDVAGRLIAALTIATAPLGGIVLWSVVHGRVHWWQISFAMLAWGMGVLDGFLNFHLSLGLALLAAAADPALGRRGLIATTLGRAVLAAIIYLTHLFGLLFYGALLVGLALGPDLRVLADRGRRLEMLKSAIVIGATLSMTTALLVVMAPSLPSAQSGTTLASAWAEILDGLRQTLLDPAHKVAAAFVGLRSYANWLDVPNLVLLGLITAASMLTRRLAVHSGLLTATAGLLACYAVLPTGFAGAYFVDFRFAMMAPWVLAVALRPDLPSRAAARLATVAIVVAALARSSVIAWIWHERQADVLSVERALSDLPPRSALLPLMHRSADWKQERIGRYMTTAESSFRHLVTLAVPWRGAFVPSVFSARGKQPLEVLPPWDQVAEPDGGVLFSVSAILDPATAQHGLPNARYLKNWRDRFDYVLVVDADVPDSMGEFDLPDMDLVRDEGFARLYRIRKTGR